jgi:hypothetical protein
MPPPPAFQEFVQMVGSEAHTQSVAAKSGTIKPEHVFAALKDLEMGEFVDKCKASATQPQFKVTSYLLLSIGCPCIDQLQPAMFAASRVASHRITIDWMLVR